MLTKVGAKGIAKKIFMLLIVAVANIVDINVIGEGHVLKSVTVVFYIANKLSPSDPGFRLKRRGNNRIHAFTADNAVDLSGKGRLRADIESGIQNANHERPAGNNGASAKQLDILVRKFFKPDPVGNYVQRTVFVSVRRNAPFVDIGGI